MQNEKGSSELQLRRTPKKWFITLIVEGKRRKYKYEYEN